MPDQNAAPASVAAGSPVSTEKPRNLWVCTGYVATGLALLGFLAYHFSNYVLK